MTQTFFICAGELSGDSLGAGLITALKKIYPDAKFKGIAGPQMIAAGCEAVDTIEALSVMGILAVLPKLPQILRLRHQIIKQLLLNPPDVFIGIDAPDFNLPIEAKLKQHGIKTVHYVCPSVWAWRQGRVKKIKKSVDLILSLLPFEKDFLTQHQVPVKYVGHRSADILPTLYTKARAREILNIHPEQKIITLLPGSRGMEIRYMGELFLKTAQRAHAQNPELCFLIAAAKPSIAAKMHALLQKEKYDFPIEIIENNTYAAIKASDVVLATSGTVTLEVFLLDKPMVVAYKMNIITWALVNLLVKVKYAALPNLLANQEIVPEFLQTKATPENLSTALLEWLNNQNAVANLHTQYQHLLSTLRCDADTNAAAAIHELLTRK